MPSMEDLRSSNLPKPRTNRLQQARRRFFELLFAAALLLVIAAILAHSEVLSPVIAILAMDAAICLMLVAFLRRFVY